MHDRAVRRRRAVLFALIAASLFLLTAYFGESDSGGLRSFQRGAMGVFAPIQEGANRAVKPVRDLFGWFGDTLHAKSQRDQLKVERDALRRQLAAELGPYGIRVVTIQSVGIPETHDADSDAWPPRLLERAPTLADVGNVAAFAASDQAAAITATAINITCGAEID
jgi:hypothetical protein